MGCCGRGAIISRNSEQRRRRMARGGWLTQPTLATDDCESGFCPRPIPADDEDVTLIVTKETGGHCAEDDDCGKACCASKRGAERSAGDPPNATNTTRPPAGGAGATDNTSDVAGYDRETWNSLGTAERRAALREYANQRNLSAQQRAQLEAAAVAGGFDTARNIINTIRDVRLEEIRQAAETERTRITGRRGAEYDLLYGPGNVSNPQGQSQNPNPPVNQSSGGGSTLLTLAAFAVPFLFR